MNKKILRIKLLLSCLFLSLFLTGCNEDRPEYISKTDFKLNTVVQVSLYDVQDEALLDECMKLCDRYERIFSRTLPESELYRLNTTKDTEVSDELLGLISMGISYGEMTDGLFDITVAPLSELWDFSGEEHQVPPQGEISDALTRVDYRNIMIDGNRVSLLDGASIDLGALAKGYIADRLKDYLVSQGVSSAIINLGGNVLCIGAKPDGGAFLVGIQKPFADRNETFESVSVTDQSVVSSGIYERGFEEGGIWYHHILNPATGYPYETDLSGATIQCGRSVDGDALSTICMSLGSEKAQDFLRQYPDVRAWLVTESGEVINTSP